LLITTTPASSGSRRCR